MSDIYISTQVAAGEHQARVGGDGGPGQQVRIGSMCGMATSHCTVRLLLQGEQLQILRRHDQEQLRGRGLALHRGGGALRLLEE